MRRVDAGPSLIFAADATTVVAAAFTAAWLDEQREAAGLAVA